MQYRISCRAFAAEATEDPVCADGRVDRCGEAIADARHGLDVLLARGFLAQGFPQHRHVMIQVVFLDRRLRPDAVEQLLLRDQPPGVLDQHQERVEHLQAQRDRLAAARKAALADVEMKRPERYAGTVSATNRTSGKFQEYTSVLKGRRRKLDSSL